MQNWSIMICVSIKSPIAPIYSSFIPSFACIAYRATNKETQTEKSSKSNFFLFAQQNEVCKHAFGGHGSSFSYEHALIRGLQIAAWGRNFDDEDEERCSAN